jgi:hypothetical protein
MRKIGDQVSVKNALTKDFENGIIVDHKTSFGETSYYVRRERDGVRGWHHSSETRDPIGEDAE